MAPATKTDVAKAEPPSEQGQAVARPPVAQTKAQTKVQPPAAREPPDRDDDRDRTTAGLDPVDLGGRCEIFPASALPGFDSPGGKAYLARSRRERKSDLFAIVVDHVLPTRIDVLTSFRGIENPCLLRVADWGTVDWFPEGRRRFVIVFERPGGRRFIDHLDDVREPMPEDMAVRMLLPALLSVIKECSGRGFVCGGIRPTNLFFKDGTGTGFALGDCVSTPVGFAQPLVMETVERSLADPAGRGPGTVADDMYALGVTFLMALIGRNPATDLSTEDLVRGKMERGSYQLLTSGHRISQNMVEPLRGLLADDPKSRWTAGDLDMWIQGRRMNPKQSPAPRRGMRPLEFNGQEYWFNRAIARGLSTHTLAAAQLIERGELDKWLRRSLSDEEKADQIKKVINNTGSRGGTVEDRIVARVAIALDPTAPIRFRGRSVLPDGFGPALAEAMAEGGASQLFAEMIVAQLPGHWVACQVDNRPEHVPLAELFDAMRASLEQTTPGQGLERVLYDMNPGMPCISPTVRDDYPLNCMELLAALERAADRPNRPRDPMDRHVAAFIGSHNKKLGDKLLTALAASGDQPRRIIGILTILADTQRRFGPATLPGLCAWLSPLLEPAIKRFHSRRLQEQVRNDVKKVVRQGDIDALLRLVDNPDTLGKDTKSFGEAKQEHEKLTRAIERLRKAIKDKAAIADTTGRQITAVAASLIGILIGTAIVLQMLVGR